jgi:hypothetical protein
VCYSNHNHTNTHINCAEKCSCHGAGCYSDTEE